MDDLKGKLAYSLENIKLMQQKLIEMEKLSALGRLTTDVANEIRNSLMAVSGVAQKFQKNNTSGGAEQEYAVIIINEVARIEKILVDTLVYSNVLEVELKREEISNPVQVASTRYRALCWEQNIALEEYYEVGLPKAKIDCAQVQQALDFLVRNAIEAMPGGGVLSMSTVHATIHNTPYLTIAVSDTGKVLTPLLSNSFLSHSLPPKRTDLV